MSERSRQERRKFLREFEEEERQVVEKLERPLKLKRLQEQVNRNAQRLRNAKRFALLEDNLELYVPDFVLNKRFANDEERNDFNRTEASKFYSSSPEWQRLAAVPENIELLQSVYAKRGITVVASEMWAWAFRVLQRVGILLEPSDIELETPAPALASTPIPELAEESFDDIPRLPLGHQTPAAYRREAEQAYTGIDPLTGSERDYTQVEVDRMDSETYRKTFIKGDLPHLTRVNFGQR